MWKTETSKQSAPSKNASIPGRREQRPETALPGQSTGAYIICPKVFRPNR